MEPASEAFSAASLGWLLPAWLVLFGLVVGSFLNVVVHRLPRGDFPGSRRSRCPSCSREIPWHENVPLVSWLALRGRCAGCGTRISVRYPLLEALGGAHALACWLVFGWSPSLAIALVFGWAVLALVFTDLEHMILPDAITLPGTYLALVLSWWSPLTTPEEALLGVLLAIFVVEGINLAYKILRGRDGFGAGDTKMLMLIGATLGWKLAIVTLAAGSALGALCAIPILAMRRRGAAGQAPHEVGPAREEAGPAGEEAGPAREEIGPAQEEAETTEGDRESLAQLLLPPTAEGVLAPAAYLALALSFLLPMAVDPARALAGLLLGLAAMFLVNRLLDRFRAGPPPAHERATELLPLAGAVAGLPPSPGSALAAAVVALTWAAAKPLLDRVLPRSAETQAAPVEDHETGPAPPALQGELPFGVFLGVGALLSLFVGEELIGWYLGFMPTLGD